MNVMDGRSMIQCAMSKARKTNCVNNATLGMSGRRRMKLNGTVRWFMNRHPG